MKRTYMQSIATLIAIVTTALAMSSTALADRDHDRDRHEPHQREPSHSEQTRRDHGGPAVNGRFFDNRYNHNHYYLPRGRDIDLLPRGALSLRFGGAPYYFHEGTWYRPRGPHFTVIAPPIGLAVPFLPPFYTTIWIHGAPYYYADDVYYSWRPEDRTYVVVQPPNETDASTQPPSSNDQLFIYPKNGQSEKQQADDRYECHTWAAKETSFDPTLPGGGVPAKESADKRADYDRAMTACLEGRGYSVK